MLLIHIVVFMKIILVEFNHFQMCSTDRHINSFIFNLSFKIYFLTDQKNYKHKPTNSKQLIPPTTSPTHHAPIKPTNQIIQPHSKTNSQKRISNKHYFFNHSNSQLHSIFHAKTMDPNIENRVGYRPDVWLPETENESKQSHPSSKL